jgi:hypothetical protein
MLSSIHWNRHKQQSCCYSVVNNNLVKKVLRKYEETFKYKIANAY